MSQITERVLEAWAEDFRKKLSGRVRRLMAMASYDLWYGPLASGYSEETGYNLKGRTRWPGSVSAWEQIRVALERANLPGEAWINVETEEFAVDEPDWRDWCHVSGRQILAAVCDDKELVPYLT